MQTLLDLRESTGITIILITHEPEIAAYGSRIISIRDGLIISDQANVRPPTVAESPSLAAVP